MIVYRNRRDDDLQIRKYAYIQQTAILIEKFRSNQVNRIHLSSQLTHVTRKYGR